MYINVVLNVNLDFSEGSGCWELAWPQYVLESRLVLGQRLVLYPHMPNSSVPSYCLPSRFGPGVVYLISHILPVSLGCFQFK